MKAISTVNHQNFKFHYQRASESCIRVTSKAFQLSLNEKTHYFVICAQCRESELDSTYDIFLINNGKIFEYECLHQELLHEELLATLNNKSEEDSIKLVCINGYSLISEDPISLNSRLANQGLSNIQPHIVNMLNPKAIEALTKLKLGVIPRVYNWLAEAKAKHLQKRIDALLAYPILLVPTLSAITIEMYPPIFNPKDLTLNNKTKEMEITRRIDLGENISDILETALQIPKKMLKEIKGKSFQDISKQKHPEIYQKFEREILVFEHFSNK